MTNTENIAKIDIKGFYDLCNRLKELETENSQLKADNKILGNELTYFKEHCADLEAEIADMKNTRKYLTAEDAGKSFARELLGKPMAPEDIAEEKAIADGEQFYYEMGTALYGDDF